MLTELNVICIELHKLPVRHKAHLRKTGTSPADRRGKLDNVNDAYRKRDNKTAINRCVTLMTRVRFLLERYSGWYRRGRDLFIKYQCKTIEVEFDQPTSMRFAFIRQSVRLLKRGESLSELICWTHCSSP